MKRWRKIIAVLLAVLLPLQVLMASDNNGDVQDEDTKSTKAGDSGSTEEDEKKEIKFPLDEKATYTVFSITGPDNDLSQNITMQHVLDEANLEFEYELVMATDLVERRNLSLNSNDYADLFFKSGLGQNDLNKYGGLGIFIPLEDLIKDYAPNLTKKLDEVDGWEWITSPDGHVYSIPEMSRPSAAMTTYWINQKWMENLGLEEPKNLDELYEVLKAFHEQDANGNGDTEDEIPLMATASLKPDLLLAYFGIGYDYGTKLAVIDDELTYVPTSDVYKDFISYVTKLYQEGILDKNAFTQTYEQQQAIGKSGDVLGSFFDAGAFLTVGRGSDFDYIALTPFEEGKFPVETGIRQGAFAITDAAEHPEILVAWVDQFYTEEGGILAWMGLEGKTWKRNDKGNWEWIIGEGYGDDVAKVRAGHTIQGSAFHPSIQPDFWFTNMEPEIDPNEVYLNGEREKCAEKGAVPLPMLHISQEDNEKIATIKTDVDSYIDQYVAKVVTGEMELEESWDTYLETLDAMGVEELFSIYNDAYQKAIN